MQFSALSRNLTLLGMNMGHATPLVAIDATHATHVVVLPMFWISG